MTLCWKCHKPISELPVKIGFRATCPHCDVELHTCTGCRYYAPGKPNDCAVPMTEPIRDREAMNFCEEFAPLLEKRSEANPKSFHNLFKHD